ncbi:MAG: hypothetical protein ACYDEV_11650 [Acidiferrobacter sp.]
MLRRRGAGKRIRRLASELPPELFMRPLVARLPLLSLADWPPVAGHSGGLPIMVQLMSQPWESKVRVGSALPGVFLIRGPAVIIERANLNGPWGSWVV